MNDADTPSTPPSPDDSAFFERLTRYLDAGLSPTELVEIERELAESPRKREAFALICLGEALAYEEYNCGPAVNPADPDGPAAEEGAIPGDPRVSMHNAMVMPALHEQSDAEPPPMRWPPGMGERPMKAKRRWPLITGIAAALLVVATIAFWAARPRQNTVVASSQPVKSGASSRLISPEPVASIIAVAGENPETKPGTQLVAQQSMLLSTGCVQLRFTDGAEAVIEAPAGFTMESKGSIRLKEGRIAVKLANGTAGFIVRTPVAVVTDLGTEFGVIAAAGSGLTDVHVFKGAVNIATPGDKSNTTGSKVTASSAAHVELSGRVEVKPGGMNTQMFVRDLGRASRTIELADLISGGDGTTGLRGGVVDQTNGQTGTIQTIEPSGDLRGDGKYHATPALPVVDGCFIPGTDPGPTQVDSAGHRFAFPRTHPQGTVRICAGGVIPTLKSGNDILTTLDGVDYSTPEHSYLFLHPSVGITFDLDAIRRLHPNKQIQSFHCVVGNSIGNQSAKRADAFVLVNGEARFAKIRFLPQESPFITDIPISPSDRFLTLATTDGGAGVLADQVLFGDATLGLMPAP